MRAYAANAPLSTTMLDVFQARREALPLRNPEQPSGGNPATYARYGHLFALTFAAGDRRITVWPAGNFHSRTARILWRITSRPSSAPGKRKSARPPIV